jgi:hypothetical protein
MTYSRSWVVLSLFTVASLVAAACSDGGSGGEGGASSGAGGASVGAPGGKGEGNAGGAAPGGSVSTSASVSASASSAASASASSAASTSASSAAGGGGGLSFAADVQPIFTASCTSVGCHGNTAAKGLDLSSGKAHHELVAVKALECGGAGRQLVEAGQPDQSYLIDKLKGMNLCGLGQRMPAGGKPALPAEQIETITAWITAGALDN